MDEISVRESGRASSSLRRRIQICVAPDSPRPTNATVEPSCEMSILRPTTLGDTASPASSMLYRRTGGGSPGRVKANATAAEARATRARARAASRHHRPPAPAA
ncbi:MAG: hypothetical protein P8177_09800, partial [Gemmatimonadota bacterium]